MRRITVVALAFSMAATVGCAKKQPTPVPEPPPIPEASPPPVPPLPEPPPPAPVEERADPLAGDLAEVNDYVRAQGLLGDVYFDYDRSELRPEARARLEANARFLKEHAEFRVTIEGHCDERGTVEYNVALGDRRASSAKRFVEEMGVPARSLQAVSYGKERPVCAESREDCWSKNRRAAFVITGRD